MKNMGKSVPVQVDVKNYGAGKIALVTGANGDIGIAVVKKFLLLGYRVFAVYQQNRDRLDALSLEVASSDAALQIFQCDVTCVSDVEKLLASVAAVTSTLDVLVNNAGGCKDNVFPLMSFDEFDKVIQVNLYGSFHVTQASLRLLRAAKTSAVVNLSSVAGVAGSSGQANYSAAKAAIGGLTRSLASELTSKGIRVNAVAPGLIDSSMVKRVPRNIIRQVLDVIPAKRLGRVDEVADVVAFLASSQASYIAGQTIVVDGGLVLR